MSQSESTTMPPPSGDVSRVVEHLFRHEAGKMVSSLTRVFGVENITLAEDVVQEALVKAMQTWPYYGIPENPAGWMMQVAKNLAYDVVRRDTVFRKKEPDIVALENLHAASRNEMRLPEGGFTDDRLPMMFVCCHPLIPPEAQVALALKTLCGFSVPEISSAFLSTQDVIAKRLVRARKKLRDANIEFEIPAGDELERRLEAVLQTLYLLFNEGYKATSGDSLVREELCQEAIRMAELLADHPAGNQPKTHALLALMLLNTARLPTRTDAEGNLMRLKEQDRGRWDQELIARGMYHMALSAAGTELTEYHLQAGIAACHCSAPSYEETDWSQIIFLYDRLVELRDRPVAALNRAIAVAQLHGPQAGLDAVAAIDQHDKLKSYYLLYAVLGEFEAQLNHHHTAAQHFRKSLELTEIKSERDFLTERIKACEEG